MNSIKSIMCREERKENIFEKISFWWYMDNWIYNELYYYSWVYRLRWFITHYIKKTNWVKTNLPVGYYDVPVLMEDALFSLVEGYVSKDQEDAFSIVVVEGDERKSIIEILYFYRVRKPELEEIRDKLMNDLYEDTITVDAEINEESGLTRIEFVHSDKYSEKERDNMSKKLEEMEKQIDDETISMMKKCVDIHMMLWC